MSDLEPVPWDAIEAAVGPPADDVRPYVDALGEEVAGEPPATAVKTVYDAWKGDLGEDRTTADQGAAYVIAYLLERRGHTEGVLLDRKPGPERLRELFWEREHTLWWMAVETGVHYALVSYWLYEESVPLARRNLTTDTREQVDAYEERRS
ncbi:MAG: hypothetical protein ABEH77_08405 [Halobacteriaceae archaeon]